MDEDIINYKFEALTKRLDAYEKKTDLILEKLDIIRDQARAANCPSPGLCVTLRVAVDNLIKVQDKMLERLDKHQEHLEKFDAEAIVELQEEVANIKLWRNWVIGLCVPIIAVAGFFTDEIKKWLFK